MNEKKDPWESLEHYQERIFHEADRDSRKAWCKRYRDRECHACDRISCDYNPKYETYFERTIN